MSKRAFDLWAQLCIGAAFGIAFGVAYLLIEVL